VGHDCPWYFLIRSLSFAGPKDNSAAAGLFALCSSTDGGRGWKERRFAPKPGDLAASFARTGLLVELGNAVGLQLFGRANVAVEDKLAAAIEDDSFAGTDIAFINRLSGLPDDVTGKGRARVGWNTAAGVPAFGGGRSL
jgi:hypothetical protein